MVTALIHILNYNNNNNRFNTEEPRYTAGSGGREKVVVNQRSRYIGVFYYLETCALKYII